MVDKIQAVRGMNDILWPEICYWQHAEHIFRRTMHGHGYREIRTPIVEKTQLFKRSIGEVTDIVEKEMYTFMDRDKESLSLRPEGTAGAMRAVIEHSLAYGNIVRLWYRGPFFRHERPQKGRYRQFFQCSAETYGLEGPDIDAEMIIMSANILDKLALRKMVSLQMNSLGTPESRQAYRKILIEYFKDHQKSLDEISIARLETNPLRILDSKNPDLKSLIANAPKLARHLDDASAAHFEKLQEYLTHAGINFEINHNLVRGLDYYTKTVFEWVSDKLGAQGTVCAGGRYDGLAHQLGGKPIPAVGFSFGMERTIMLMQQNDHDYKLDTLIHAYLIMDNEATFPAAMKLANYLRSKVPGLHLILHCGGGSIKSQIQKADKSGALYAIILGEHELKTRSVSLKNLREQIPQQTLYQDELADYLHLKISKK